MKITYILLLLICPYFLAAQLKQDYVWIIGLIDDTQNPSFGAVMDFTKKPGEAVSINRKYDVATNASISDSTGNLLFYTNGCFVINAEHEIMPNGDSLNLTPDGEVIHVCRGRYPSYTSLDGALILPQPGNDSLYYLFHYTELLTDTFDGAISLNYTLVNMKLDGGRGDVVEKNVEMRGDWVWNEELQAVRHANDRDWWIVVQDRPGTEYLRWLLTPDGLEGPWVQPGIGPVPDWNATGSGQAKFSPDGTRYARTLSLMSGVMLYDFDRATGILSNYRSLPKRDSDYIKRFSGGLAFSPSGQYLYCNNIDTIWQWDTWVEGSIADTRTVIGVRDDYDDGRSDFGRMVPGPDCRIYVAPRGSTLFWHVINWPDRPGLESDFVHRAVALPTFSYLGLPNFPNYRLGTSYATCDMGIHTVGTTVTSVFTPQQQPALSLEVYPNPTTDYVNIMLPPSMQLPATLSLTNSYGQVAYSVEVGGGSHQRLSVSDMPAGMYVVNLQDANKLLWRSKLIKQ